MDVGYRIEIVNSAEWHVVAPSGRRVITVRPEIAQVLVSVLNAERLNVERDQRCVCGLSYELHLAGRACQHYRRASEPLLRTGRR